MKGLFSTAYLPPVSYFRSLIHCDEVYVEARDHWQKQTYRNRCRIAGPNGLQSLNIPIVHNDSRSELYQVEISYAENWPQKHWQSIQTAYSSSPFFEILGPELKAVYEQRPQRLYDLNDQLLRMVLDWLQFPLSIQATGEWVRDPRELHDFREAFHPKKSLNEAVPVYPQVFDDKHGFIADLSIIDLLFNEGPAAFGYLKQ